MLEIYLAVSVVTAANGKSFIRLKGVLRLFPFQKGDLHVYRSEYWRRFIPSIGRLTRGSFHCSARILQEYQAVFLAPAPQHTPG